MLIATTQVLHAVQQRMHRPGGLHTIQMCTLRTPDAFSCELKAEIAMRLQRDLFEELGLQKRLPTEAANDPPAAPDAA